MRFKRGDDRFRLTALFLVDFLPDVVLLVEDCAAAGGPQATRFKHRTTPIREMRIRADDKR
jgi:hypothetical protein